MSTAIAIVALVAVAALVYFGSRKKSAPKPDASKDQNRLS